MEPRNAQRAGAGPGAATSPADGLVRLVERTRRLKSEEAGGPFKWGLLWPVSVASLAVLLVVGVVKETVDLSRTFTSGGDVAFIELQVRQALSGDVAVGVYSRYGWHHPGPALFYLFAPVYWATGNTSRSLFLDSWLFNAACGLLAIVLVHRLAGELAARVAAVVLMVYVAAAGFGGLINPWNPSLLALPILLGLICTAGAERGSLWSWIGAFIVFSIAVETHIAVAPLGVTCLIIGLLGVVWAHRRRKRAPGWWKWPAVTSAVAFALLWGPPIGQQIGSNDGNLSALLSFYLSPPKGITPRGHSLPSAIKDVSDYVTIIPFGNPTDLAAHPARLAAALLIALIGLGGAVYWWKRDQFLAWMGLLTIVGFAVAIVASARVIGPYEGYLFEWCQTLPLPALVSGGSAVVFVAGRYRRSVSTVTLLSTVAAFAVALAAILPALDVSYIDSPGSRLAAQAIESAVGSRSRVFVIHVLNENFADGALVLSLVKAGYTFRMTPSMDLYGGDTATDPTGPVYAVAVDNEAPPPPGSSLVGTFGSITVWQQPAAL